MRYLNEIIIHCSATPEGRHHTVEDIRSWHVDGNGWSDIGYHYVIYLDGTIHKGRPIERQGAHVKGHNKYTVGVCYVGGIDTNQQPKDTRTEEQQVGLQLLCRRLVLQYPSITKISGHNEYDNRKACPSFNVQEDDDLQAILHEEQSPGGGEDTPPPTEPPMDNHVCPATTEEIQQTMDEVLNRLWKLRKQLGLVE